MADMTRNFIRASLDQGTFSGNREAAEAFVKGVPYVPPGVSAALSAPKPGSTITVLGAPEPRSASASLGAGGSSTRSGALAGASSSSTGKTLLGQ